MLDSFQKYVTPCIDCASMNGDPSVPKVARGGDYGGSIDQLRTGYRTVIKDISRSGNRGFRCARDAR